MQKLSRGKIARLLANPVPSKSIAQGVSPPHLLWLFTVWINHWCRKKDRRTYPSIRKPAQLLAYLEPSILWRYTIHRSEKEKIAIVHAKTMVTGMIFYLCAMASAHRNAQAIQWRWLAQCSPVVSVSIGRTECPVNALNRFWHNMWTNKFTSSQFKMLSQVSLYFWFITLRIMLTLSTNFTR